MAWRPATGLRTPAQCARLRFKAGARRPAGRRVALLTSQLGAAATTLVLGLVDAAAAIALAAAAFAGPLAGGLALQYLGRSAVWLTCAAVGTVGSAGYYALLHPARAPRTTPLPAAPDPREQARA